MCGTARPSLPGHINGYLKELKRPADGLRPRSRARHAHTPSPGPSSGGPTTVPPPRVCEAVGADAGCGARLDGCRSGRLRLQVASEQVVQADHPGQAAGVVADDNERSSAPAQQVDRVGDRHVRGQFRHRAGQGAGTYGATLGAGVEALPATPTSIAGRDGKGGAPTSIHRSWVSPPRAASRSTASCKPEHHPVQSLSPPRDHDSRQAPVRRHLNWPCPYLHSGGTGLDPGA